MGVIGQEDAGRSAAEVALGAPLALPGQLVDPSGAAPPASDMTAIPMRQQSYAEVTRAGSGLLDDASWVYVRRGASSGPLEPVYAGPYLVLQRSNKVFRLQVGCREEVESADRLKPQTGSTPTSVAPSRRGRPPRSGGASISPGLADPVLAGGSVAPGNPPEAV